MSVDNAQFANALLQDGLWWRCAVDQKSKTITVSPALQAMFDHEVTTLKDLMGMYASPIIDIKINEILQDYSRDIRYTSAFETIHGKHSYQQQLKVYEQDGARHVWATCIDVTERVNLEREIVDAQGRLSNKQLLEKQAILEQQNRAITESYEKQSHFLAMLSHELRSPLLGICSLVERLRAKEKDPDSLTALRTIHITAEQSTFLVNDILTYSQTEFDEVKLHPMQFSLVDTLENVKQLTKSIAADKGLIVSLIYNGGDVHLMGDSVRLSQVLINLIANSIKFTEVGGVTLEVVQKPGNMYAFKVTDSGEGIAEDQLEHIFEPFAQLETHTGSRSVGSGLGLLVVKKLVALMGGVVFVRSTLGVGTTFYFELQLADAPLGHALQHAPEHIDHSDGLLSQLDKKDQANAGQAGKALSVLIADDAKINRMVLSGYLQEANCSVVEADNGLRAWELFQEGQFEYVLLDIQMPKMDGIEVCQSIRRSVQEGQLFTQKLKGVFAITAGGDEEDVLPEGESIDSIGFDQWFIKPVSKQTLLDNLFSADEVSNRVEVGKVLPLAQENSALSQSKADAIDWQGIEVIPEEFINLLDSFLKEVNTHWTILEKAVENTDWHAVAAKAHYIKGNCMLFQLEQLVGLMREVERVAKSGESDKSKRSEIKLIGEKLTLGLKYLEKSALIGHNAI